MDALKIINKEIENNEKKKAEIDADSKALLKVRKLLEKVKTRGNFILSTTDWPFDNTPFENLKAFSNAGIKYGAY